MERDVTVGEEIDLRQYVLVLIKRKWLIIGLTVLAAAAAYIWSMSQPEMYEATASVIVYRMRSEIVFAPEFKTIEGPSGAAEGLAALVESATIAQAVLGKLRGSLSPEERDPFVLIDMIESKVKNDTIQISASSRDPEKAALIASTWAEEYERHVNAVYSPVATEELLESTSSEFKKTNSRYEAAEKAVSDFLSGNSIAVCRRALGEKRNALRALDGIKRKHLDAAVESLADCYAERRRIRRLFGNAKALRQQIGADGGASTGTALALLLLEEKVYAREGKGKVERADPRRERMGATREMRGEKVSKGSVQLQTLEVGPVWVEIQEAEQEGRWQLDLSSIAADSGQVKQRKEIAALVQVLEKRLAELDAVIAEAFTRPPPPEAGVVARSGRETWLESALIQEGMKDIESAMRKIDGEILKLEGKIAVEQGREKEFVRARDQAWETYQILAKKVDELQIMGQVKGSEVRLASRALVPRNPVSPKIVRNVGLAAVVGFMMSCFLAFFVEFVGTIPKP